MTPLSRALLDGDILNTWEMPGALARRLMLVAVLAVAVASGATAWVVSQVMEQDSLHRLVQQQNDEVQLYARLLAGKIEQNQKILSTVASSMMPSVLQTSRSSTDSGPLHRQRNMQRDIPLARFFDTLVWVQPDGTVLLNLRHGRAEPTLHLDERTRSYLQQSLRDGRPIVSGPIGRSHGEAPPYIAVLLTQPLHSDDGRLLGVVGATVRLQSQALLPPAITLPQTKESRLVVFTREGTILLHPEPTRILGKISEEPDLAMLYSVQYPHGLHAGPHVQSQSDGDGVHTHIMESVIISTAEMPLPQWLVARISYRPVSLAQSQVWASVGGALLLLVIVMLWAMAWCAQPLARLQQRCRTLLSAPQHHAAHVLMSGLAGEGERGEVGALVQVLRTLLDQRAQLHQDNTNVSTQMQAILNHCPVGVLMTHRGQLQWLSRQASDMLGYHSPDALRGHTVCVLHPPDVDFARLQQRVRLAFTAYGSFDGDMCLQRKDGETLWVRAQAHPLGQDGGGGTVWFVEDLTAARQAVPVHDWASMRDSLTLLPNRAALEQRLDSILVQPSTQPSTQHSVMSAVPAISAMSAISDNDDEGTRVHESAPQDGVARTTLLFLDLDHFSVINEGAGHEAGNDVLRHVARLISAQVRPTGWVARVGGDKFAVLLPDCPQARARAVAEKISHALQAWQPSYQGRSFTLSASIGMVQLDGRCTSVARVLHAADMTCYAAKRAGRNRVVLH